MLVIGDELIEFIRRKWHKSLYNANYDFSNLTTGVFVWPLIIMQFAKDNRELYVLNDVEAAG